MILPKSSKSILPFRALPRFVASCVMRAHEAERLFLEHSTFSSEAKPVAPRVSVSLFVLPGLEEGSSGGCPLVQGVLKQLCKLGRDRGPVLPWMLPHPAPPRPECLLWVQSLEIGDMRETVRFAKCFMRNITNTIYLKFHM